MFNSRLLTRRNLLKIGAAATLLPVCAKAQQRVYILGGAGALPIPVPSGLRLSSPAVIPLIRGSSYSTAFDIKSLIPAATQIAYLDPINGVDAFAILNDPTHPYKNLSGGTGAFSSAANQIQVINLTQDFVGRVNQSWQNTQAARSLSFINRTGFRYISTTSSSSVAHTWTVNGSFGNVFQSTIAAAGVKNVMDFKPSSATVPQRADGVQLTNVPKIRGVVTNVASIAAVSALAGSWFYDGAILYVRAIDDRSLIGDPWMVAGASVNNGRFPTTLNNITLYAEGIDFCLGSPFFMSFASSVTGCVFAHNNCSLQGGSGVANGLSVASFSTVYGYRSLAAYNFADGFNYHSFESDGITQGTSPTFYQNECVTIGNGTTGSSGTSDNGTTCHDFCNGQELNDTNINSDDRVVAITNSGQLWMLGTYVGQAIKTAAGSESVAALLTSKIYMDGCNIPTGSNNQVVCEAGATLGYTRMAAPSNTGPGSLTPY